MRGVYRGQSRLTRTVNRVRASHRFTNGGTHNSSVDHCIDYARSVTSNNRCLCDSGAESRHAHVVECARPRRSSGVVLYACDRRQRRRRARGQHGRDAGKAYRASSLAGSGPDSRVSRTPIPPHPRPNADTAKAHRTRAAPQVGIRARSVAAHRCREIRIQQAPTSGADDRLFHQL